jgi:hypothetical protein
MLRHHTYSQVQKNVATGTTALKKCKPLLEKHSFLKISNFKQHARFIRRLHTTVALFCHPDRQIYLIDVERLVRKSHNNPFLTLIRQCKLQAASLKPQEHEQVMIVTVMPRLLVVNEILRALAGLTFL